MTTHRLSAVGLLTIGLGLSTLLLSAGARAEGAEPAAAPAATIAADPAAQIPDASVAAGPSIRTWLRPAKPESHPIETMPQNTTSPWRAFGVLVVLGGLGGAAIVMRRRRAARPGLPESATRVRVLSSARIGPKANAVVAEIGGRVMLLGVTDTNVARLAWLDQDSVAERDSEAPPEPRVVSRPILSPEPVETADAELEPPPGRGMAARFGEVLDRALGVKPGPERREFRGNPGVAAMLAAGVEDVVEARGTKRTTARMGSAASVIVEEQVAGLRRTTRRRP